MTTCVAWISNQSGNIAAGMAATLLLGEDPVPTTTIMDSLVVGWFREHCREIGLLWLNWNSAGSYRRYAKCMAEWADELGIEPDQVEQLIFGRR